MYSLPNLTMFWRVLNTRGYTYCSPISLYFNLAVLVLLNLASTPVDAQATVPTPRCPDQPNIVAVVFGTIILTCAVIGIALGLTYIIYQKIKKNKAKKTLVKNAASNSTNNHSYTNSAYTKSDVELGNVNDLQSSTAPSVFIRNHDSGHPYSKPSGIRLCQLHTWPDFQGFGFDLRAEKGLAGHYVGEVDASSPAAYCGLQTGDKIIEINGQSVRQETHQGCIRFVKMRPGECQLLVADPETALEYREVGKVITMETPGIVTVACPHSRPDHGKSYSYMPCVEYERSIGKMNKTVGINEAESVELFAPDQTSKSISNTKLNESLLSKNDEVAMVPLSSSDIVGLGFNITGSMRDGIFISHILPRGPAHESGRISQGDRLLSMTISFENMVYEDALTILSYASPYPVIVQLQKTSPEYINKHGDITGINISSSMSDIDAPSMTAHPSFRSQSLDDLSRIGRATGEDSQMANWGPTRSRRTWSEIRRVGGPRPLPPFAEALGYTSGPHPPTSVLPPRLHKWNAPDSLTVTESTIASSDVPLSSIAITLPENSESSETETINSPGFEPTHHPLLSQPALSVSDTAVHVASVHEEPRLSPEDETERTIIKTESQISINEDTLSKQDNNKPTKSSENTNGVDDLRLDNSKNTADKIDYDETELSSNEISETIATKLEEDSVKEMLKNYLSDSAELMEKFGLDTNDDAPALPSDLPPENKGHVDDGDLDVYANKSYTDSYKSTIKTPEIKRRSDSGNLSFDLDKTEFEALPDYPPTDPPRTEPPRGGIKYYVPVDENEFGPPQMENDDDWSRLKMAAEQMSQKLDNHHKNNNNEYNEVNSFGDQAPPSTVNNTSETFA